MKSSGTPSSDSSGGDEAEIARVATESLERHLRGVPRLLGTARVSAGNDAKNVFHIQTLEQILRTVVARVKAVEVAETHLLGGGGAIARADMEKKQAETRGRAAKIVEDGRATATVLTQMIETRKAAVGVDLAKVVARLGPDEGQGIRRGRASGGTAGGTARPPEIVTARDDSRPRYLCRRPTPP